MRRFWNLRAGGRFHVLFSTDESSPRTRWVINFFFFCSDCFRFLFHMKKKAYSRRKTWPFKLIVYRKNIKRFAAALITVFMYLTICVFCNDVLTNKVLNIFMMVLWLFGKFSRILNVINAYGNRILVNIFLSHLNMLANMNHLELFFCNCVTFTQNK